MIEEANLAKELLASSPSGIRESVNDVWGLILGDRLSYYRCANAMKLSKKLHEEAERLGGRINPDRVPDQFAYEWGEAATRKSDDTIQEMFARLLAKAATEGGSTDERLIYALNDISVEDAVLFKALYGNLGFRSMRGEFGLDSSGLHALTRDLESHTELALDNLVRVNLIRELTGLVNQGGRFRNLLDGGSRQEVKMTTRRLVRPSALGRLLYDQIADESDPLYAVMKARAEKSE